LRIKWGLMLCSTNQLTQAACGSAVTIPFITGTTSFYSSVGSD
jgi:hypothetical protein